MCAMRPTFPGLGHFLDSCRLGAREIVHLGAVAFHVVKLPRAGRPFRDKLPVANAQCAITLVLPEKRLALDRFAGKRRHEAATFWRLDLLAIALRGKTRATDVDRRRHDVDQVSRLMLELTLALDPPGPVRNQRRSDSTFVHEMFIEPEGRAGNIRPRLAISQPSLRRTRHGRRPAWALFPGR